MDENNNYFDLENPQKENANVAISKSRKEGSGGSFLAGLAVGILVSMVIAGGICVALMVQRRAEQTDC